MHSHIVRRWWVALAVLVTVLLSMVNTAFAQGDTPVEGVHYRFTRGPNSEWRYVRIQQDANLHTPELARQLHTDMFTLRVDNPTATLAVCRYWHKKQERYRTSPGISDPPVQGRRTNAVWKDCPEADKYVYVVPGESLVLKGKQYPTFDEEQKTIASLRACTSPSCVMDQAKALGANVSGNVPAAPAVVAPPPPSPEPVAAVPVVSDNTDMITALKAERDGARESAAVSERNKTIMFVMFIAAMLGLVYENHRKRALARVNAFYLADKKNLSNQVKSLMEEPRELRLQLDRQRVELEGKVVTARTRALAESKDLMTATEARHQTELEERRQEVVTHRQAADAARNHMSSTEAEFRQLRMRFAHFITDLHWKLRGGTMLVVSDTSDLVEESMEVLGLIDAKNGNLNDAIKRLGLIVDGEGVNDRLPFNVERLLELADEVTQASVDLEPMFTTAPPRSLLERVKWVASDSALSHYRDRMDQLLAKFNTQGARVDVVVPRVITATTEEEYGGLLAVNAELEARVQMLEGQLAELDRPPGTLPGPSPVLAPDYGEMPEVHVTHDDDDEHDRVTVVTDAAKPRPNTTLIPRNPQAPNSDIRTETRKRAFAGAREWLDLHEGHVVAAVEHDSELPILRGIVHAVNKLRWRCLDHNGANQSFDMGDLLDEEFFGRLRATAPAV